MAERACGTPYNTSRESTQNQQSRLSLCCKRSIESAITQINKILTSTPILHTHLLKTNGRCVCVFGVRRKKKHGVQNSSRPMIITTVNLFPLPARREKDAIALSPWRANLRISLAVGALTVKDHRSPDARHVHTARRVRPASAPQLHSATLITSVCPRAHCFYSA